MSTPFKSLKNQVIIADPYLLGPVFERSVVYLADHNEDGAMGFIINSPTGFTVQQAVRQLKGCNLPLYYGGPVDETLLFYVHNLGDMLPQSVHIKDDLYWGGEFSALEKLHNNNILNNNNIKFFIGYSGWSPKQLENEIKKKSWIINDLKPDFLFKPQKKDLWKKTLELCGNDKAFLGNFAHNPSLN